VVVVAVVVVVIVVVVLVVIMVVVVVVQSFFLSFIFYFNLVSCHHYLLLRTGLSGDRLTVWFSTPVQTGRGSYTPSCTRGTWPLSWGLSGREVAFTTHPIQRQS